MGAILDIYENSYNFESYPFHYPYMVKVKSGYSKDRYWGSISVYKVEHLIPPKGSDDDNYMKQHHVLTIKDSIDTKCYEYERILDKQLVAMMNKINYKDDEL